MKVRLAGNKLAFSAFLSILGISGILSSAVASPVYPAAPVFDATNTCATSQLTTSTACVGTIIDPKNDQPADYLAHYSFFGISNWTRVQKSDDVANNPAYNLLVSALGQTGTWQVSDFEGWSNAVIVLKGGDSWSAYLLNVLITSGNWNTLGLINNGGNHPDLSHLSLYVGGIKSGNTNVVPLPAALPLLVGGLAGLGWVSRRQKRRARNAA